MKVATVVGARPQFIKCAPVSRAIRKYHTESLIHTGQHYDPALSDVFFADLGIPAPDYTLNVGSCSHGKQTGAMLGRIETVLKKERPQMVVVYGDTNSTLAGALAAAKLNIPVAHVEAGLRSFDRTMPEETNRVVADHISDYLFCPTATAVDNLRAEGITAGVHLVGDVMTDLVLAEWARAERESTIVDRLGLSITAYAVATLHRPANVDGPDTLWAIATGLGMLGIPVVFPCHPRTAKQIARFKMAVPSTVRVIDPLPYRDMLKLVAHARVIITDSGGIQKEAYILGTRCVTVRETTEWPETVHDRWNVLIPADAREIAREAGDRHTTGPHRVLFKQGAAERIAWILTHG